VKDRLHQELILIVDFGAQYSQLIARRVREQHAYCEIVPYNKALEEIKAQKPQGIILSGGPNSVYGDGAPKVGKELFATGIPVLGICYGMQLMAHVLGGEVNRAPKKEFGKAVLDIKDKSDLLKNITDTTCWMSHGDEVIKLPEGFSSIASTDNTPNAAIKDAKRKLYGVQFHPEVVHTPQGKDIIKNFLFGICGLKGLWDMASFVDIKVAQIKEQVGSGKVICGLSGGVDSAVTALLAHKAIGDQLTCIFVDHGFMRKGEAEQVVETFRRRFHINLVHVDASERFLKLLKGIEEPERKRKIIGNEFIRVFEEEAAKMGDARFLAQGTVYPDVIESGTTTAAVIKSHHNVGGLPEDLTFKLIEPLRELFKDEVRRVGEELGMPEDMVWRHPFPGPGLAIRIMGEITKEKLDILREADAIYLDEIRKQGLYRDIWQAFCVLSNTRTVGVMGDERTYAYVLGLRAVNSTDGMTADWYRFPYEALAKISNRIINEVPAVNRVVYDISSKPPSTIEWE